MLFPDSQSPKPPGSALQWVQSLGAFADYTTHLHLHAHMYILLNFNFMKRIKNLIMPYIVLFVTGEQPLGGGTHAQIFQEMNRIELQFHLCYSQTPKPPNPQEAPYRGFKVWVHLLTIPHTCTCMHTCTFF